jgi:hypothetical protein
MAEDYVTPKTPERQAETDWLGKQRSSPAGVGGTQPGQTISDRPMVFDTIPQAAIADKQGS